MFLRAQIIAVSCLAMAGVTASCVSPSTVRTPVSFAPACATPNSRQLDFFLGEWNVEWSTYDGRSGTAVNSVVLENGGCVLREHFRDLNGVIEGTGLYSYFVPGQLWILMWMDSNGASIMARGGPPADGSAAFVLTPQRGADPNKQYRMVFEDVSAGAFTWRYQSRAEESAAWTDETVSHYSRRPDRAGAATDGSNLPVAVALAAAIARRRN